MSLLRRIITETDEQLRRLQREVSSGNLEAAHKLIASLARSGRKKEALSLYNKIAPEQTRISRPARHKVGWRALRQKMSKTRGRAGRSDTDLEAARQHAGPYMSAYQRATQRHLDAGDKTAAQRRENLARRINAISDRYGVSIHNLMPGRPEPGRPAAHENDLEMLAHLHGSSRHGWHGTAEDRPGHFTGRSRFKSGQHPKQANWFLNSLKERYGSTHHIKASKSSNPPFYDQTEVSYSLKPRES